VIVIINCLILVFALPNPHVGDCSWLDDPRHSADRDDLRVESNIQVSAWAVRLYMGFEVGIDSLVVVSTVSGMLLSNGKSNPEVALVQSRVRMSILKDVT
jgi:hypothetical protein